MTTCALLADPDRARVMDIAGRRRVLENYTHAHTRDRLRSITGLPAAASGSTVPVTVRPNDGTSLPMVRMACFLNGLDTMAQNTGGQIIA